MPELPEVQTTVDDLNKKIFGRRIVSIWHSSPSQISILNEKKQSFATAVAKLKNLPIRNIDRRGKYILIHLGDEKIVLMHLKLTGRLLVGKWKVEKNRTVTRLDRKNNSKDLRDYIRMIFYLNDGRMLGFSDVRRFGRVIIGNREKILSLSGIRKMGPEPLDATFTPKKFKEAVTARRKTVKQTLLDQTVIAGIGNIYADETLWRARVHPQKLACNLEKDECVRMFHALRYVLREAIRLRGTSMRDFRDTEGQPGGYRSKLAAYQRDGSPCFRCGTALERIKLGGRSTHFCTRCQKL